MPSESIKTSDIKMALLQAVAVQGITRPGLKSSAGLLFVTF